MKRISIQKAITLHSNGLISERIARELHDSAGQTLAALSINLTRMAELANHSPAEFAEETKTSHELVQQLTPEIRTTSYLFHPPLLDAGLLTQSGDFTNYRETGGPGKVVGEMAIFRQLSVRAVQHVQK